MSNPTISLAQRRLPALDASLRAAAIPITSVVLLDGTTSPPTVQVVYDPSATAPQQAAGEALRAGFDWSQSAQDAFDLSHDRSTAVDLLTSPAGTYKLLRAVGAALLDQLNTLRSIIPRPILSMTRVNQVVTVTTFVAHGLTDGEVVFITGADVAAYNGSKTVTVTGATTFTCAVVGTPVTPATGSLSMVLGTVPSLEPITQAQVNAAITAKITSGAVDNALKIT